MSKIILTISTVLRHLACKKICYNERPIPLLHLQLPKKKVYASRYVITRSSRLLSGADEPNSREQNLILFICRYKNLCRMKGLYQMQRASLIVLASLAHMKSFGMVLI